MEINSNLFCRQLELSNYLWHQMVSQSPRQSKAFRGLVDENPELLSSTPPKITIEPEIIYHPKRKVVFQPSLLRFHVKFWGFNDLFMSLKNNFEKLQGRQYHQWISFHTSIATLLWRPPLAPHGREWNWWNAAKVGAKNKTRWKTTEGRLHTNWLDTGNRIDQT